jgi:predicted transcriptional regulator
MSVKESIHQWVDELPDDSPTLLEFYQQLRLDRAIDDAEADIAAGRVLSAEEVRARYDEKCRLRRSA